MYIVEYEGKIYHYDDIMDWNVYEWRNWLEASAAFKEPVRVEPTDKVLGAQVCVWSIHYEDGIVRTAENTAAMAERVWTVMDGCTPEAFETKLQSAVLKPRITCTRLPCSRRRLASKYIGGTPTPPPSNTGVSPALDRS